MNKINNTGVLPKTLLILNKLFLKSDFFFLNTFLSPKFSESRKKSQVFESYFSKYRDCVWLQPETLFQMSIFSLSSLFPSLLPGPILSFLLSFQVFDYQFVSSCLGLPFADMSMSYLNILYRNPILLIFSAYWLLPIGKDKKIIISDSHYRFGSPHGFSQ